MNLIKSILGIIALITGFTAFICLCGFGTATNYAVWLAVTLSSVGICVVCIKVIETIEWFDYKKEREERRNGIKN